MKARTLLPAITCALACLGTVAAHADRKLSPQMIDQYDPPGLLHAHFKAAIHDLVDAHESLDKAQAEQKKFERDLPVLQQQAADAQAKTAALQKQLALYDHPDETTSPPCRPRSTIPPSGPAT